VRVADFLTATWLPAVAGSVRPTTFAGYRCHVVRHLVPRLGSLELENVSPPAINRFYAELVSSGLNATTVRRIHATLQRALRDAVRWDLLDHNPAERSDPPRSARPEMKTWSAAELRSFLSFVRRDELYVLWLVLAMTGMRRGEALGLRWGDVDLERRLVVVRRTIVVAGHEVVESEPKTAKGKRVVALDETTAAALGDLDRGSNSVFVGTDGSRPHPTRVSKRFARLVVDSGLPRIRLHDLRHTHATLALEAGVNPKIISERLGHSTVAFTLDVYSHALQHMQEEAAEKIGGLVFGL
jgi:integrase